MVLNFVGNLCDFLDFFIVEVVYVVCFGNSKGPVVGSLLHRDSVLLNVLALVGEEEVNQLDLSVEFLRVEYFVARLRVDKSVDELLSFERFSQSDSSLQMFFVEDVAVVEVEVVEDVLVFFRDSEK